jgi:hypothetical protein
VELLLMLQWVDEEGNTDHFESAVSALDRQGLMRRLRSGLDSDLTYFPALIALVAAGGGKLAEELAEALASVEDLPRRLPSEDWFRALRSIGAVAHDAAQALVPKFDEVVVELVSDPVQLDDVALWQSVGAYTLWRRIERRDTWNGLPTRPESFTIYKDPVTRLFSTAWLTPCDWVHDVHERAVKEIAENAGAVPAEMSPLLSTMAASRYKPRAMEALSWPAGECRTGATFGPFIESDVAAIQNLLTG